MRSLLKTAFFLFFLFVPWVGTTLAQESSRTLLMQLERTFSEVIEQARPTVVYLQVRTVQEKGNLSETQVLNNPVLRDFFGNTLSKDTRTFQDPPPGKSIFGSGFFLNSDGYIITNSHIIRNAREITAILADKTHHHAKIVGEDKELDVALLKIEGGGYPYLPLGDSAKARAGNWVLAVGSPYRYIQTVTAGIISATSRNSVGVSGFEHLIQTDAAINPGNSGGPLLNISGEVIGVNTAFMTRTGGYMGIGFAIPANMLRQITEQLISTGKVVRGWIGLSLVDGTDLSLRQAGRPAIDTLARIVTVARNSPAAKAGLQENDLLYTLNDTRIWGAADFRNQISLYPPGKKVEIGFYRNGVLNSITVTLGKL